MPHRKYDVVCFENDGFQSALEEILKHKLAVRGWTFFDIAKRFPTPSNDYEVHKIGLTYCKETLTPVASSIIWSFHPRYEGYEGEYIGCYVKPPIRRKGVGSLLKKKMILDLHFQPKSLPGIKGSEKFWNNNDNDNGYKDTT